jgi:hypothetical protein
MSDDDESRSAEPPYWTLISVLFSSQPLTPALARLLYESAFELYRTDRDAAPLRAELVEGTLESLRRDVALGAISGPSFEARIETARGAGTVRFLLTWQGIEWLARNRAPAASLN